MLTIKDGEYRHLHSAKYKNVLLLLLKLSGAYNKQKKTPPIPQKGSRTMIPRKI